MKYNLGDIVYFLENNKIIMGEVVARDMAEYKQNTGLSLIALERLKNYFGETVKRYGVRIGYDFSVVPEETLFSSKEELIKYISRE